MDNNELINQRLRKLEELKASVNDIDDQLLLITKELNWDYKKLVQEDISNMVTCSVNSQHRIPISKAEVHEQKCSLHHQGYSASDKFFPEHSGSGSFVTLTAQSLHLITKNVSSPVFLCIMMECNRIYPFTYLQNVTLKCAFSGDKCLREVPQTSANYDQNFDREEKLAIYDYVIANTQKQKSYVDLWLQPAERNEEKREMAAWEIAAAERDAKRRRASYRNKVHTNRKTHTEILREVIEAQMEAFKLETVHEKVERDNSRHARSSHHPRESDDKRRRHDYPSSRGKEERDRRRDRDKHSKHREHKRSPSCTGSDKKSRSRSQDKYRKWKSYEGRSHSHRSSHAHRR